MPDEPEDDILLGYMDTYHAAAIGMIISAWAGLEYQIDEVIWGLAGLEPEPGACLTSQFPTVVTRINALIALARVQQVSAERINKLNGFRKRAIGLSESRNRIVHDPWFYAYKTKKHFRLQKTAKAKLDYAYKPVTEEELKEIETNILALRDQFSELRSEILHAFWSSSP